MRQLRGLFALLVLSITTFASPANEPVFRLQVLHFADMDGDDFEALHNVRNLSALVEHFRRQFPDSTLLLSSGDNYVPGVRYHAASDASMRNLLGVPGPGRGDIALLNALRVTASAVGNHELDEGPAAFVRSIRPAFASNTEAAFPGARFPYLSANIDFTTDLTTMDAAALSGQQVDSIAGRVAASATVVLKGETIGLVGGVTPDFLNITQTGTLTVSPEHFDAQDEASLDALAAELQIAVDALTMKGINKIIMLTHMQQLAIDRALAPRLRDVDIIIAGGSNTLLADADDRLWLGDEAAGPYPLIFESGSGDTTLVVNTAGDYRYLGRLVVDFDVEGRITGTIFREDSYKGSYATSDLNVPSSHDFIPEVGMIVDALAGTIERRAQASEVFGYSAVVLEGGRSFVRTQETNLGSLVADANLDMARMVDSSTVMSLLSGGGLRASIEPGAISQLDIENTLSFNADLMLLTVTAAELVSIMEHAVSFVEPGATPGAFPQMSGLQVRFDSAGPGMSWQDASECKHGDAFGKLSRLRTLIVTGPENEQMTDTVVAGGILLGDPQRTFRLVTVAYLADGGDGYPYRCLSKPQRVTLRDVGIEVGEASFAPAGTEQDALAEYLRKYFVVTPFGRKETGPSEDLRIRDRVAGNSRTER